VGDPDPRNTDRGFKIVKAGDPADSIRCAYKTLMYLKLRIGGDRSSIFTSDGELKIAVRAIETRKYGTYLGGTSEFKKAEGLIFNLYKNELYVIISQISSTMTGNEGDIQLNVEKEGANYKLLVFSANDTDNKSMDSQYVGTSMSPLVIGEYLTESDSLGNKANPDKIVSLDNLRYIGHNTLLIGEYTSYHINNAAWVYNTETEELVKIMTAPLERKLPVCLPH